MRASEVLRAKRLGPKPARTQHSRKGKRGQKTRRQFWGYTTAMHVLFLTTNTEFLKEGDKEQKFLDGLVSAADVLHVVVWTRRGSGFQTKKLNDHAWIYPTNSFFGFKALSMMRTARFQVSWQKEFRAHVVYSDDVRASGWAGAWLAFWYDKVWVVNIRTYEWGARAFRQPLSFFGAMPLSLVLPLAHRICIFSDITRLYLSVTAAHHEDKIIVFPRLYDTESADKEPLLFDVKQKYPEINFSLLVATTLGSKKKLSAALGTLALLRANPSYQKAGLIVVALGGSKWWWRLRAWIRGLRSWVHFEDAQALVSCLKTANIFLYLSGGEENEDAFIRAAAAHTPIIAVDTKITHALIKDGVNGLVVPDASPATLSAAIMRTNESSQREIFRVNSSLYMTQMVMASPQEVVAALQALWDYQEAPPQMEVMPNLDPHPLAAPMPTRLDKFKQIWREMFPKKESHLEVSNRLE